MEFNHLKKKQGYFFNILGSATFAFSNNSSAEVIGVRSSRARGWILAWPGSVGPSSCSGTEHPCPVWPGAPGGTQPFLADVASGPAAWGCWSTAKRQASCYLALCCPPRGLLKTWSPVEVSLGWQTLLEEEPSRRKLGHWGHTLGDGATTQLFPLLPNFFPALIWR